MRERGEGGKIPEVVEVGKKDLAKGLVTFDVERIGGLFDFVHEVGVKDFFELIFVVVLNFFEEKLEQRDLFLVGFDFEKLIILL